MIRHIRGALVALCIAAPGVLAAQSPVTPGQVVRVSAPEVRLVRPIVGTVLGTPGDTLIIETSSHNPENNDNRLVRVVPLWAVESLEVPAGRETRVRGAILGGLLGGTVGVLAAIADRNQSLQSVEGVPCADGDFTCARVTKPYPVSRTLAISLGSTAIGAAAGILLPGRRWQRVYPVAPQASVDADGTVEVSGTMRF
jgi:hypothetical protein